MATNWGAFAGGLAAGMETGQRMRLARERAQRDNEEWGLRRRELQRQSEQRDRQEEVWEELNAAIARRLQRRAAANVPGSEAVQPPTPANTDVTDGAQAMPAADPGAGLQARELGANEPTRPAAGLEPIDRSRPIIHNPDGSFSTERTITVEADGRHYLIPTIAGGRQLSEDEAVQAWRVGTNRAVGEFGSAEEAESAAKARSTRIGQVRGAEAGQGDPTKQIGFQLYQNTHLLRDPEFLDEAAQIFLRARMPEGIKWLERGYKLQQENAADALKSLLAGDAQRATELFNASGRAKVRGFEPITDGPDRGKWRALGEDGRERIIDPGQELKSMLDPKEFFALIRNERADARAERQLAEQERHQSRMAAVAERNAQTNEAYRRDMAEAAKRRAERSGGGGAKPMSDKDFNNLQAKVASQLRAQMRDTAPTDPAGKKMPNPLSHFVPDIQADIMADVRSGVDVETAFNNRYAEWGERLDQADRVLSDAFAKAREAGSGWFKGKQDAAATLRAAIQELESQGIPIEEQRRFAQALGKDMALFQAATQGLARGRVANAPASPAGLERRAPPAQPSAPPAQQSAPATPQTREEVMALPKGTRFINPADGRILVKK